MYAIATGLASHLCVGLIACKSGAWRAGVFTLLLIFLSPRFLGHPYNNPKDIPFTAAIAISIYFMMLFFEQFPKIKKTTILLLILSIAFLISIRIGGLILFGFFSLFALVWFVQYSIEKQKIDKKDFFRLA